MLYLSVLPICFAKQVFYHLIIDHILIFWSTAVGAAVVSPKHRIKASYIFHTLSFSTRENIFFYKHNTLIAISLIALIAHYILPAFISVDFSLKKQSLYTYTYISFFGFAWGRATEVNHWQHSGPSQQHILLHFPVYISLTSLPNIW